MEENPELIPGDYYSILNVPRFATTDEIRAAYKRLAVTYHPDRHSPESGLRTEAKEKFTLIKTAYETLIDDKLRALYDKYGAEGLKSGWELAARTKSTEEMLKEFEKLKKREEERLLDSRVHARSAITMSMSAADLIDSLTGKLNILEVTGMSLSQSVKFPFSERDQATLIGNVRHLNGNGVGSLTCKYNRSISPESTLFSELSSTGSVHAISIGMWRRLSPLWAAQLSSVLHSGGSGVTFTIDRTLSSNTAAQFTYQQGYNPYMSLVISSQQELYSITTDIRVNDDDTSAGLELTRVISKKAALKLGGRVNLNGDLEINIGGVRRMSKISKFSMFISVNPDAISLNLGFQRAGHKLSFPILVTREVTLQNIAGAMVVPSVLLLLLKYVIIDPQQKKRKKRKIEKLRKETADQRIAAKKAAESAIKLMMTNVQRKVLVEESRRGLIVVYACYGCLDENNKESAAQETTTEGEERVIDVTIPLQYLVEDSQLHLHESSSKSHLLGFFDPCPGEEKKLYIKYLFKDKLHEVTISDSEAIGLPLASHLIKYVN